MRIKIPIIPRIEPIITRAIINVRGGMFYNVIAINRGFGERVSFARP